MIRLRPLGHIELSTGDGADANTQVAQPKRFALLCYLAIPKPSAMHRRDTLLGVFWPEGDTEHSRTALRQALAQVRRVLGDDVIVRRGTEEVEPLRECWQEGRYSGERVAAKRLLEPLLGYPPFQESIRPKR